MKPTQTLPENYGLAWSMDLKQNMRLNIILQVIGLGWMVLSGGLLMLGVLWLRPDYLKVLQAGISGNLLTGLLLVVVTMTVAVILHEMVHGLFFWLFARHRPEFGIGPGYAYAAMPDWYYPRGLYLVVGLAPLVLLTLLGLLVSAFAPIYMLGWLLVGMVTNSGGAIGDMYICWRIASEKPAALIKDTGDGFQLYRKGE